jgi:hypothetical protein
MLNRSGPHGCRHRATEMPEVPITLDSIGLTSWAELYSKDPSEIIRLMSEKDVPVHAGDAFLAVLVVRSVADLAFAMGATIRCVSGRRAFRFSWAT